MSELEFPAVVADYLMRAVQNLSVAHAYATESEGDRKGLTGSVRDMIFGLNTAVESLAQKIQEDLEWKLSKKD